MTRETFACRLIRPQSIFRCLVTTFFFTLDSC